MSLVQKEPQSIYIGSTPVRRVMKGHTQVRPAQSGDQHYVFDFTTSVADWTLGDRLSFVSGTGIVRNTSGNGGNQYAYYNNTLGIDRQNVKRITYKTNTGGDVSSWNGSIFQGIINGQEVSERPRSWSFVFTVTSQFSTGGGRTGGVGYINTGLASRIPASTQNVELFLDFENKEATVTYNGTVLVNQVSISDADIQAMKNLDCQYLEFWMDAPYNKYISLIDLLVEY